jgi:polyisoprenyl-phosphate glycosyltransferase
MDINTRMCKIAVLIPVFNDWECLNELLYQIENLYQNKYLLSYFIIDDASTVSVDKSAFTNVSNRINIVSLKKKSGHQHAIAIGLDYIMKKEKEFDFVLIMDSDGEDEPRYIDLLIKQALEFKDKIVFVKRKKRHENKFFKFLYFIYRIAFRIISGEKSVFGNFSIVPTNKLDQLITSNLPICYFSSVLSIKLPYIYLKLPKGKRIHGKSKMNYYRLIIHGVRAISLFSCTLRTIVMVSILVTSIFVFQYYKLLILFFLGILIFLFVLTCIFVKYKFQVNNNNLDKNILKIERI